MAPGSICSACRRSVSLVLRARRAVDALFAMEEALKCRAVASVIAELPDDSADLTATRRLSLAARDHRGLGLLLRHRSSSMPSAAMTRWNVAAASGPRDDFGGIGTTSFLLSLVKNRRGPCGRWNVAWDHHACVFVPKRDGFCRCGCGACRRTASCGFRLN